jgi:hypothetical protein
VVISPTNTSYMKTGGNILINYTASVSPNGYPISYYNITLRNSNNTIISTIQGNNSVNLTYSWDISAMAVGQYIIGVKATDNESQSTVGTSPIFTIYSFSTTNGSESQVGTASLTSPPLWSAQVNVTGSGTCSYNFVHLGWQTLEVLNGTGASVPILSNSTTVTWTCSDAGDPYSVRFSTAGITEQYQTVAYSGTSGDVRTRIYIGTGSTTGIAYSFSYAPTAPHYNIYMYSCAGTTNASCIEGATWTSESFTFAGGLASKALTLTSNETVLVVGWTTTSAGNSGSFWGTVPSNVTGNDTSLGINTAPQKGSVDLLGFIIIAIAIFAVWKFMTKPKREK